MDLVNEGVLTADPSIVAGDEIALFCNGTAKMSFCWNASAAVSNKASLAEGIDPLPMAFPSDDGVPELCGGIWGFGIFDNGDEAKAAAAKEFIKFVCDDAEQGPQSVYATGLFPVRASFGDIYTGTDKAENAEFAIFMPHLSDYYQRDARLEHPAHRMVEHAAAHLRGRRRGDRGGGRVRDQLQRASPSKPMSYGASPVPQGKGERHAVNEGGTCMQKTVSISRELKATRRRENVAGYLFMAPSLLFFLGFVIFPMGMCLVTSAFNYTMTDFSFIGLQNYAELFSDAIFGKSLVNTVIIVVASVPTVCFFSLGGIGHLQAPDVYTLVLPLRILPAGGYRLRGRDGGVEVDVQPLLRPAQLCFQGAGHPLAQPQLAGFARHGAVVHHPDSLHHVHRPAHRALRLGAEQWDHCRWEAAEVDGATSMQVFWRIKWPQIMPTTLYILVITTINSFQCFALIQLLTSAVPTTRPAPSCTTSTTKPSAAALWLRQRRMGKPAIIAGVQRAAIPSGQERSVRGSRMGSQRSKDHSLQGDQRPPAGRAGGVDDSSCCTGSSPGPRDARTINSATPVWFL